MYKLRLKLSACPKALALAAWTCLAVPVAAQEAEMAENTAAEQESSTSSAPAARFNVFAIDVLGVTKLTAAEIETIIYPFMGPDKDGQTIEQARLAIQSAYTAKGYETTIVEIPQQTESNFAQGVIQIAVNEVPIGTVSVVDAKYTSADLLLKQVPSAKSGEPLNFKTFQAELAQANRFPDREVYPNFQPGEAPGTLNVELQVKEKPPYHASAEINNDNSPNTTALRVAGSVSYSNMFGVGHTLTISSAFAPQNTQESAVVSGSYSAPLLGSPLTLLAYGYKSNSNIAAIGGTNVLGDGYQVGVKAIYRLPTTKNYQALNIGLDFKSFNQDISLDGVNVSTAPIRYIPLVLGYSFSQSGERSALNVDLSATFGLRVVKRLQCFDPAIVFCNEDQFTNRELDSIENFAHINLDADYTLALGGDWNTFVRVSGQYADSHLVTNEQFALGGMGSIRGYFQSEVVGDYGLAGGIELRAPSFATQVGPFVDELRFFAFADGGIVRIRNPLPDAIAGYDVASVGAGLRLGDFKNFSAEAVIGLPLISGPNSVKNDPRYTFIIKGAF